MSCNVKVAVVNQKPHGMQHVLQCESSSGQSKTPRHAACPCNVKVAVVNQKPHGMQHVLQCESSSGQ